MAAMVRTVCGLRRQALVAAVLLCFSLPGQAQGDNTLHQRIAAVVLVADPDQAADSLERWAEQTGGYILLKSSDQVTLRFPYPEAALLRERLEELSEDILELSPSSVDLREQILEARARLRSREEVLRQNLALLDRSDVSGTLAIEQEILALIGEIEQLKGSLQKLDIDRTFSLAEISFKVREQTLPENIPSSFEWINQVDFYSFVRQEFITEAR